MTATTEATTASQSRFGSCSAGALCLTLPATRTPFDIGFGTQDTYSQLANVRRPHGEPSIAQRMSAAQFGSFRQLGADSYTDAVNTDVSPTPYYEDTKGPDAITSSAVGTGGAITAIPVKATTGVTGGTIYLVNGATYQAFQTSGAASCTSNCSIPVSSQIPTANFPAGSYVMQGTSINHIDGWSFLALDRALSDVPASVPKEVQQEMPMVLYYCAAGSWSNSTIGCYDGTNYDLAQQISSSAPQPYEYGMPTGLLDPTYGTAASYYRNVVLYFKSPMRASGSGSHVTYTARNLKDTSKSFAGDAGDCVTATVIDSNGNPDWVEGAVTAVGGSHSDTLRVRSWSTAHSWDPHARSGEGYNTGSIVRRTPAAGAAYNVASCTPPGGLSSPESAQPWPRPPSVGNVSTFEVGNEPDLSYQNLHNFRLSSTPGPTPMLNAAHVLGGRLVGGESYAYEMAAANGNGNFSTPSQLMSITLPSGSTACDGASCNAVTISWTPTTENGNHPVGYVIYGRSAGSPLAIAGIGEYASGGMTWTDNGTITPSSGPVSTDDSMNGAFFTPPLYTYYYNKVAPAMKAAGKGVKISGPTLSNAIAVASIPWLDPYCTTTDGLDSRCSNGDPGFTNNMQDYIPYLVKHARPEPDLITFHAYGSTGSAQEATNWNGLLTEVKNYRSTDKTVVDRLHHSVWIDEANWTAGEVGSQGSATDYRGMMQPGSAYLADNIVQWAKTDPLITQIVQHTALEAYGASFALFGLANIRSSPVAKTCVPYPACDNITSGEPDLEYWTINFVNNWMTIGRLARVSNVPDGFDAVADQTGPDTVVLLVVNKQVGSSNGNGAPGNLTLNVRGARVADVRRVAINGETNLATGPRVRNLGSTASVSISAAGYEVDLFKITTH